jgi:adenylyltransferase/sulfurtransferase
MALSDAEIERYSRQIILPEIGGRGQERLRASVVAVAGAGDLASVAARYLAGAGIGTLLLDDDALAAFGDALRRVNPAVQVRAASPQATAAVCLAADLPPARLAACVRAARTRHLAVVAASRAGWIHVSAGDDCAACAAAAAPPAAPAPPLDVVVGGVLGSLLALAALELALGLESSVPALHSFAPDTALLTALPYARRPDCPACG